MILLTLAILILSVEVIEGAVVQKWSGGNGTSNEAIPLSIGGELVKKFKNKNNKETRYCVQGQASASPLYALVNYFVKTTVSVQSNFPMTWYAVRGISTDDFYSLLKSTIFRYVLRTDEES